MADKSLHLPVDWQRKAAVLRLARRMKAGNGEIKQCMAQLYFVCMWTEWASNPEEWRPLNKPMLELATHDWRTEDLTYIIEQACGWNVEQTGRLLVAAIEAGVYEIKERGDIAGLTLPGWCEMNEHLMPGFESMQSKGGKAARVSGVRKMAVGMAAQQQRIMQGDLMLNAQSQSPEEQKAALALVIQLDRHCGRPVRSSGQYNETVLRDAVAIVRRHSTAAVDVVLGFLSSNRENPEVVKAPEQVLAGFDDYLARAQKEEG